MRTNNPIVLVDDDKDDMFIYQDVFSELGFKNRLHCFGNGADALKYLKDSSITPALILSDINMPNMNGIELRKKISDNAMLEKKCKPFVFISTSADVSTVENAYQFSLQGYFQKPSSYKEIKTLVEDIVKYCSKVVTPTTSIA